MTTWNIRSRIALAVTAGLLAFWMFIGLSVSYCPIDDFQWASDTGLFWWLSGALNGRYVGNMFSIILCRFPPVKVLLIGLSMFLIPTLAAWMAVQGKRGDLLPALLLCHTGVLLMPGLMWNEVYGWVSGFSIYGVSTLLFLIWLLVLHYGAEPGPVTGPAHCSSSLSRWGCSWKISPCCSWVPVLSWLSIPCGTRRCACPLWPACWGRRWP